MTQLYTPAQLRQVVPQAWVHYSEIRVHHRSPKHDCCQILRSRLTIPVVAWNQLERVAGVTFFFDRSDLLLLPAAEKIIHMNKFCCYVRFERGRGCIRWLLKGVYPPGKWRVETYQGVKMLRICGASFADVNRQWLTSWHDIEAIT
jgi:hypothetical protein